MSRGRFHLFSTRSALPYARKVVSELESIVESQSVDMGKERSLTDDQRLEFLKEIRESSLHVGDVRVQHFRDGEMNADLGSENVRDRDVFLFQAPYTTTNGRTLSENLFEAFVLADALNHAKAKSVTLVSLYYPYGRGDKQHSKGGIPAAMYANMLSSVGVDGMVTFDFHADQIAGFFPKDMKIENLRASPLLIDYIRTNLKGASVCAPDAGAGKRTQYYAKELGVDATFAYKRRSYSVDHEVDELWLPGSPENKGLVLIVDDMIASGGTIVKLMDLLKEKGVERAYAVATHPLLIDPAVEDFDALYADPDHPFEGLVTTDSILHDDSILSRPWYHGVDTSRFIAKALYEIHTSGSLTQLHDPNCVERLGLRVE